MKFLNRLFSRAPSESSLGDELEQHAVLIRINAADLTGSGDDIDDLATLEDLIQESLSDEGEVDGHDVGAEDATIYCYGADAETMFKLIRPTLEQSSLARRSTVTLRFGGPDTENLRQIHLTS